MWGSDRRFKVTVLIYYWDERDGPNFNGWWIGPKAEPLQSVVCLKGLGPQICATESLSESLGPSRTDTTLIGSLPGWW